MKRRILSVLLSAAILAGFSLSASAAAEVFKDDFAGAELGGDYAATSGVSVADGKLKLEAKDAALVGVTLTKAPVENFTLEFDCNISDIGGGQFGIITGIAADAEDKAPSYAALGASSIMSNGVDSTFIYQGDINSPAGRHWIKIQTGADIHVRLTVNRSEVSYGYKQAGQENYISMLTPGLPVIAAKNGYVAIAMNAAGTVTIDNISLTDQKSTDPEPQPDPNEPYEWTDNFDGRTELGDQYVTNLTDVGSISVVDGKMKFDKIADAQGAFLNTRAMGNKFAVYFDLNMQDGSACPAFLFGIDSPQTPIMYWDKSADRFSIYMDKYMIGRGETQLDYVPESGKDTDVVPESAAFFPLEWSALEKDPAEYLNFCLVFDEENGENVLRVYYKLNTAPESEMQICRSVWKGVDPAGYMGIVAQGDKSADFTIDNLKVTTTLPEMPPYQPPTDEPSGDNPPTDEPGGNEQTPGGDQPTDENNGSESQDAPETGVPSGMLAGIAALAAIGGVALTVTKKKKSRNRA